MRSRARKLADSTSFDVVTSAFCPTASSSASPSKYLPSAARNLPRHDRPEERHERPCARHVRDRFDPGDSGTGVVEPRREAAARHGPRREAAFAVHEPSLYPLVRRLDPRDVEAELTSASRAHAVSVHVAPGVASRCEPARAIPAVRVRDETPDGQPRSGERTFEASFVDALGHGAVMLHDRSSE